MRTWDEIHKNKLVSKEDQLLLREIYEKCCQDIRDMNTYTPKKQGLREQLIMFAEYVANNLIYE